MLHLRATSKRNRHGRTPSRAPASTLRAATLLVGSWALSACLAALPAPAAAQNRLANPGFETGSPQAGAPSAYGVWSGDACSFRTTHQGVTPHVGSRMLQFIYTGSVPSVNTGSSEQYQIIDLSNDVELVQSGNAFASVSARFNRVAGDAQTDRQFSIWIMAFAGAPSTFAAQVDASSWLALRGVQLDSDGAVTTWEKASTSLLIPANADFLGIRLAAVEDVVNDGSDPELDGHYCDDVRVQITPAVGTEDVRSDLFVANGPVSALVTSGDTLYVGGTFTEVGPATGNALSIDGTTGAPLGWPGVTGTVYAIARDGTGGWYVGGSFTHVGGQPRSNLAHVRSDHTVSPWNPDANGVVYTMATNGTTVYAGGAFSSVGGQTRGNIVAIDATSGAVTAWNPNANGLVESLALHGNTVYACGAFTTIGGQSRHSIAALSSSTGTATSWNPDPDDVVYELTVSGSTVYVGGPFTNIGGATRNWIAALDSVTGNATAWNPNANGPIYDLEVSGGTVYVGGFFSIIGGQARNRLAALSKASGLATSWNPNANGPVEAVVVRAGTVYVGGEFATIAGASRNNLAAIDSASGSVSAWNPNVNDRVRRLVLDGGAVLAGGDFSSVGAQPRNRIAALNASTGSVLSWNPNANAEVFTLAVDAGVVYAGGYFTSIGGQPRNRIAALSAATGLATSWNPDANSDPQALVAAGGLVYAGGNFQTIGGQTRERIAALDRVTGSATGWRPAGNGNVWALAVHGGLVYAAGEFTNIGGATRNRIAALDPATALATSWNPNADGTVWALAARGTTLYAGGDFTQIGGQSRNRIAALDPSGAATAWNPGADGSVRALALGEGVVYAGGAFAAIGGASRSQLAALSLATGTASAWAPVPNGDIEALAVANGAVFAGGEFTSIDGLPQTNLAGIAEATHTITTAASPGGVIVPSGAVAADGATRTFTFAPNAYSRIDEVRVDGVSVGAPASHTFADVSTDHHLSVTFATDTAAARRGWIADSAPVAVAPDHQVQMVTTSDDAGGAILAWVDGRTGSNDIRVQRVDASGAPLWGAAGVLLTGAGVQEHPLSIAADGQGGAIVVWKEQGTDADLYAQRVSASGGALWTPGGVLVCNDAGNSTVPSAVAADGQGGAIIAWDDERVSGQDQNIRAQRIGIGGAALWIANGVAVCTAAGNQLFPAMVSDQAGGAIIAWFDGRSGNQDLYAQRVNASGIAQWTADGVALSTAANANNLTASIAMDGEGGAIVVWQPGVTQTDIRAQRVQATGALPWGAGVVVCGLSSRQQDPIVAADGEGGALVAWEDARTDAGDIYAQRLNASGVAQWTANGEIVCNAADRQGHPLLIADETGGAVVAWLDARAAGVPLWDVYAQRIDALGSPLWGASGVPLCTDPAQQGGIGFISGRLRGGLVPDGGGGWIVTFTDERSDTADVYAQRISAAGVAGFDHAIAATAGPGGTTSPAGTIGGFTDSRQTIEAIPSPGYHVANLTVDGDPLGAVASYTFVDLGASHAIAATFLGAPVVNRVEPAGGGDDGALTATVVGVGFQSGATVKLTRSGEPDLDGAQVEVAPDGRSLTATFDLAEAALGAWNVVVSNPDLSGATLTNGFTVALAAARQIRVDVLGPERIRANRRKAFDLVLENLGDQDVRGMPLWITGIPAAATVELDFPLAFPPGEPDSSLVPDSLAGEDGFYLPLLVPRVPPGVTVRRIYLTVPPSVGGFRLGAGIAPSWRQSFGFRDCLASSGTLANPLCVVSELDAIDAQIEAVLGIAAWSGVGVWTAIARRCEGASTLAAALAEAEQTLDFLVHPFEGDTVPEPCARANAPLWQDLLDVSVVTAIDPNDKLGPNGYGSARHIAADQWLPYSIRFENLPTATAAAQRVEVVDQLDPLTMDFNTVSLGPITFGHRRIEIAGGQAFTTDVDLGPNDHYKVRVSANFDRATGVLYWSLAMIDSITGEPPADDTLGFLPRNRVPPEGEGSLLFTVQPKPGLAGGASIVNRATILFDGEPRDTPPWSNFVDVTPPESQMLPLGTTQDSARFTLRWGPVGSTPDLRDYSIYVSEDGGPFRAWREHVATTADHFHGVAGRQYRFYSQAQDSSGNLEAPPASFDAATQVAVPALSAGNAGLVLALEGVRPNPAVGSVRAWFTLPSRERAVFEVIDVAGRRVMRREVGLLGPGRHSLDLDSATRRPGLYFLRLSQGARTLRSRVVVLR